MDGPIQHHISITPYRVPTLTVPRTPHLRPPATPATQQHHHHPPPVGPPPPTAHHPHPRRHYTLPSHCNVMLRCRTPSRPLLPPAPPYPHPNPPFLPTTHPFTLIPRPPPPGARPRGGPAHLRCGLHSLVVLEETAGCIKAEHMRPDRSSEDSNPSALKYILLTASPALAVHQLLLAPFLCSMEYSCHSLKN
jgi:hypothetical protein